MGRQVVEFGTRRAHSPEAGALAARAAYIGGCAGTSDAATGFRYGVPVFGTAAHSWVMSFATELEAFSQLQKLLGENTIYLIDNYDTLEGARRAASLGRPLWGVRLDSGNLAELVPAVRKILDDSGLPEAKIMATGDLNEYKIHELLAARLPIDVFGVGTELSTSADKPSLSVVYKMVELETKEGKRFTLKLSEDKVTLPGAKQIFRFEDGDVLSRTSECIACNKDRKTPEALLRPVMIGGRLIDDIPSAAEAREYAAGALGLLPVACHSLFQTHGWKVELSEQLRDLNAKVRKGMGA
jgi:nicotinate phosphoribosyltransferase